MPHQECPEGFLSVTEVLSLAIDKPFLRYWYGKNGTQLCEQIKSESQKIGTYVHAEIERRFEQKDYTYKTGSNEHRMVNNFWEKFVKPFDVKAVKLEQTHRCNKYKLQGTFDAIIDTSKGRYIADWKTSSSLDKITVPLQQCAYDYLQRKDGYLDRGVAVRIDKEKDVVSPHWFENLRQYWPIFKSCIKVARWIKFGEVK